MKKNNFKILTVLIIALCGGILFSNQSAIKEFNQTVYDQNIGAYVSRFMESQHYSQQDVNDSISSILYDEYFEKLDPAKNFFYYDDIKSFENYRYQLDDMLKGGDVRFAFQVFNLYMKRLNERMAYVKDRINKPFDFTINEYLDTDSKKAEWINSKEAMDELWRKRIKNSYLMYQIIDESTKEKEKKGKLSKEEIKAQKDAELFKRKSPRERLIKSYDLFYEVYEEYDNQDILEKYLSTFTQIFDPHSSYMSARTVEDFNISMSLSLQGIGATLTTVDGFIKITKIIKGGPADIDGRLKAGDRIIAVSQDGVDYLDVIDMPLRKAISHIRGKKGTKVHLTIIDGDKGLGSKPVHIDIVRDEVKIEDSACKGSVKTIKRKVGGKDKTFRLGVISVPSFYADFKGLQQHSKDAKAVSDDVKRIIGELKEEGIDGLIIDLRSNGGGSLDEVVKMTGLFIDKGAVVQVSDSKRTNVKSDYDGVTDYDGPLLVMVNGFSASASEIFAGAIQDYGRGVIVGDKQTHGKGTVQTMFDLSRIFNNTFTKERNPGVLKFTIQKFYRVSGGSTQKKGVVPDIIFPSYLDKMEIHEGDLDHALKWDEIEIADIEKKIDISPYIPKLKKMHQERTVNSERFQALTEDIEKFSKEINEKKISLNKEKRTKERNENEKSSETRRKLINGDNSGSFEETDKDGEKIEDIYLDESMLILSDLIELSNNS